MSSPFTPPPAADGARATDAARGAAETDCTVLVGHATISPAERERLAAQFPAVRFVFAESSDGMAAAAPRADVIFSKGFTRPVLDAAVKVRWIQAGTAGIDGLVRNGVGERDVVVTNARGAHGVPMAENVLTMALCFATRMHRLLRTQKARGRIAADVLREKFELHGQTMVVLGLGDIGGTLAHKAKALGLRVLGVRRSPEPYDSCDAVYTQDRLHEALPEADHVAVCLPLTPETRGIIGEAELRLMKPTAYVYNVGRGACIDGDALRRALREGWIAGAGLDCVAPTDTPADDDPLWDMDEVILSMHTSGSSPFNSGRITDIFAGNLARYLRGEPMVNVVDVRRGY